jgi:murein DD-endopeptidase MepM/ murein hydrolase activator NlpD
MVGAIAIMVVVTGSTDSETHAVGLLDGLEKRLNTAPLSLRLRTATKGDGLNWAVHPQDRMLIPSKASAMRAYIRDGVKQRRDNRDYIMPKYYVRVVAKLGPVSKTAIRSVPAFDPFKLYANSAPLDTDEPGAAQLDAKTQIIELNGILPIEDGQEMQVADVASLILRIQTARSELTAGGELLAERAQRAADLEAPQTTVVHKTTFEEGTDDDADVRELAPIKVQRGDTLPRILARLGAQAWQVRAMTGASRSMFPDSALLPGYEVRGTVLPAATRAGGELVRFGIYDELGAHKVTVTRNATGEYVPSSTPGEGRIVAAALSDRDQVQDNSLFASLHATIATQEVPSDTIMQIMRIHAYATDFRQPVRPGDGVEFFFEMKGEDRGIDGDLGDLLATAITAGGVTQKFYRFSSTDGSIDFYDAEGSTSRKFLMRRPVRGEDVRLTSGFGLRRHPLLMTAKMHTGVDWACAPGTPIMAAGNGVIEEAGAKGEYGNYVRVRHANGYKTAYAHMQKFAPGVGAGVQVLQGQIIGYVGSTGVSSGPHLHYEVLVKNTYDSSYSHVDPRAIQVPNDRALVGKDLADFKRELTRIEGLLRRPPVATRGGDELASL